MPKDQVYLVVSDFHLSEGRKPETGHVSRNEDFFFDEEFASFLLHHESSEDLDLTLIINGDFFDFLQVTSVPEGSSDLSFDETYGLRTGPEETVWKLGRIAQGHPLVFDALARFSRNNRIVFVTGNHDIELNHARVRAELIRLISNRDADRETNGDPERILFEPWFFFDGFVYAEHGHQYDPLNSFENLLDPRLPSHPDREDRERDDIDLPMGSFFVRYLFNRVETSVPYADNVKPATRFLSWFVKTHPIRAYQFLLTDGREMLKRLKRNWKQANKSECRRRLHTHLDELSRLASRFSRTTGENEDTWIERLRRIDELRETSVFYSSKGVKWRLVRLLTGPLMSPVVLSLPVFIAAGGAAVILLSLLSTMVPDIPLPAWRASDLPLWLNHSLNALKWLWWFELIVIAVFWLHSKTARVPEMSQVLRNKAREIDLLVGTQVILMGHSHDTDQMQLENGTEYFNTGTWTKVFGEEHPLLRKASEFTYVKITVRDGKLSSSLMKWESSAQVARLAFLFEKVD